MSVQNQEWLDAVHEAQQQAAEAVNKGGEIFYATPENFERLRQIMVEEHIDMNLWTAPTLWVSAIIGARADDTLQKRPTAQEQARIRDVKDRQDGHQRYRKEGDSKPEQFADIKSPMDQMLSLLRGEKPVEEAATPVAQVEMPTFTRSYEELSDGEKGAYRKGSAEQMRTWLRNRARYEHEQKYPSPTR
jgi:hypothetical protein